MKNTFKKSILALAITATCGNVLAEELATEAVSIILVIVVVAVVVVVVVVDTIGSAFTIVVVVISILHPTAGATEHTNTVICAHTCHTQANSPDELQVTCGQSLARWQTIERGSKPPITGATPHGKYLHIVDA